MSEWPPWLKHYNSGLSGNILYELHLFSPLSPSSITGVYYEETEASSLQVTAFSSAACFRKICLCV